MDKDENGDVYIISARLAPQQQSLANDLRKRFFPPERNYIQAHLTLFHTIDSAHIDHISTHLHEETNHMALDAQISSIKRWRTGFAWVITCPELSNLHRRLQKQWDVWLSAQDRQKLWPHITLQNKATEQQTDLNFNVAKSLFVPSKTSIVALDLWRYEHEPWSFIQSFEFAPAG